ncbi:MAG: FtsW/RodA/SpoVE family cell cycle protein [Erysipelotrichaceae bacterium]
MFKLISKVISYDSKLFLTIVFMSIFSIIMVASASVGLAANDPTAVAYNLLRQIIYFIIGYFLYFFAGTIYSHKLFKTLGNSFALILTIMLLACLAFDGVNGAKAWIQLGFFSLQPSEFAKAFIIIYAAVFLPRFTNSELSLSAIIKKPAIVVLSWLFIILFLQNDLGSAVVIVCLTGLMVLMLTGKVFKPLVRFTKCCFILLFGAIVFFVSPVGSAFINSLPIAEYQKARITSVANPFHDIYSYGFQLFNSLLAFAKSDWWGQGYGNSTQKFGYLPESRTDFILPIIVEELGIFGLLVVVIPYIILIYGFFKKALSFKSASDKMILVGTVGYLVIHIVLNVGGASGLIPLTGVPLLLVSSGGSSTFSIMLLLGVCASVIGKNKRKNESN